MITRIIPTTTIIMITSTLIPVTIITTIMITSTLIPVITIFM